MHEFVEYEDEGPVTYVKPSDRVILEGLKYALNSTIREVYSMLIKALSDSIDPIRADGEVFEFSSGFDVPEPNARVNLYEAFRAAERQAKACQMMLAGEMDRARLVSRNTEAWMRFWIVRGPTPEVREMFERSLEKLLEMRRTGLTEEE
jgi:hypothetical protein